MKMKLFLALFALALFTQPDLFAEQGDDSPMGVSGIQTAITTGCLYDPNSGSAQRQITDIVIPGLGAYPLKWTRYFNSHVTWRDNKLGGAWRFSYLDYKHFTSDNPCHPDGRRITGDYGVEESVNSPFPYTTETLNMSDGGKVNLNRVTEYSSDRFKPVQIIDPYGQITTLSWVIYGYDSSNHPLTRLDKVTEPGGRYLQINWDTTNSYITSVQAFDGIAGHGAIASVTYTWSNFTLGGNTVKVLTRVDYSDGTFATYTYTDQHYPGAPVCTYPFISTPWHAAVLATADDVRYNGPMRQIAYQYYPQTGTTTKNMTRVLSEKNFVTGEAVSTIAGVANNNSTTTATETRGDGPTRTFNYYSVQRCMDCPPPDSEQCRDPQPLDGKLSSYTDFLGHTTTLTYATTGSAAGFITAVTDASGRTTTYTRSTLSWAILRVTFPPTPSEPLGSHIDQTFTDEHNPYYLASRTDELGRTTTYTRDTSHRITRKDYPTPDPTTLDPTPAPVFETFTYNNFNEVLTHRMTRGGTESFTYDARGLKTSYTDALGNVTTYTYYTAGPWTDRVQTVTYPLNASVVRATETYDYDRAYDANGENSGASTGQAAVAGRGLVTRITHADGTYQSFGYDKYGNKLWQEDELRHRTTLTYDSYNRVLTTTDPLGRTITNNYVPTGKTSSWITTSSLPFYTTLPSTKKTTFYYDGNWRKTRVQQAPNTADEANAYFTYDNVGNLLTTQDPRGNVTTNAYDNRNRLTSTTDALTHATSFTYDAHSNKLTETRANNEVITYVYDKLNR